MAEENRLRRSIAVVRPRIEAHITWLKQDLSDIDEGLQKTLRAQITPRYRNRRNREGLAIERVGLIISSLFVLSILFLTHFLNANVYGVVVCVLVVALAARYSVVAGWALKQKRRLDKDEAPVAEIKDTLKTNRTMPAIDRAIAAGAIAATAFSQDSIELEWLTKWWVMFPIILTVIVSVGKMYTIWQPIELWHMLTKERYRDEDERQDA